MGLTGFVITYVFIALFSPAQGERNQMVNTKFTRPVNEMPMSIPDSSHLFRIGSTDPPSMRRRRQIFCSLSGALAGKNVLRLIAVE